MMLATLC